MTQPPTEVRPSKRLRALLSRRGTIRSLGAHDVFTALLVEQAGFETVFIGGFGVSASPLGLPDLNFITLTEMADQIHRTAARIRIPLIADGDTGHGDLHHVQRTVSEFERAGASGVILEDQVAPKRCGHFEGKRVVPAEEMVAKVRAAKTAQSDPDIVLIARTDARDTDGLDEAVRRANLYGDAGADVVFIEAPVSESELADIPQRVHYPLLVNMLYGGKTPILPVRDLEQMGYKLVVAPIESLLVTAEALRRLARTFLDDGSVLAQSDAMVAFTDIKRMLGVDRYLALRGAPAGNTAGQRHAGTESSAVPAESCERMEL